MRIVHLNVYNGYTGALLLETALVEGGSDATLPVLPANDAYTHTGWESVRRSEIPSLLLCRHAHGVL